MIYVGIKCIFIIWDGVQQWHPIFSKYAIYHLIHDIQCRILPIDILSDIWCLKQQLFHISVSLSLKNSTPESFIDNKDYAFRELCTKEIATEIQTLYSHLQFLCFFSHILLYRKPG